MPDLVVRPAPLTPSDCDLRDFPSMLLDHRRLLTSETWIEASLTPRLGHALISLWCEAFQQVPAASLPNNDMSLLRLSMCPTPKDWNKIKARALAGWLHCADGRLYHPVVAEKALEAWLDKLASRLSSGAGNAKRWKTLFDPAPIDAQILEARNLLAALNPLSRSLAKRRTSGTHGHSEPDPDGTPADIPSGSQGKGREGKGSIYSEANASAADAASGSVDNSSKSDDPVKAELWKAGRSLLFEGGVPKDQCGTFLGVLVNEFGAALVLDAVRAGIKETPADPREYLKATCLRMRGERQDVLPQSKTVPSNAAERTAQELAELAEHNAAVERDRLARAERKRVEQNA